MAIDDVKIESVREIDIDLIKVKKRVRNRNALIEPLIESIKKYGLLEPILIDQKNRLVAGYQRLRACKCLGYDTILAKIVEVKSDEEFLLLELEENTCRLQFSSEELKNAKKRLNRIQHPNFFLWLWYKIKAFFTR